MKKKKKEIVEITEEEMNGIVEKALEEDKQYGLLYEMARFDKEVSGLPMIVWVAPNDGTNTGQHNAPRLKFQDNTSNRVSARGLVPISIDSTNPIILVKNYKTNLPSKDIVKLKQWIIQNYNILLRYWNGEVLEGILMRDAKPYVKTNAIDNQASSIKNKDKRPINNKKKNYVIYWIDNVWDANAAYNDAIKDGHINPDETSFEEWRQQQIDNYAEFYETIILPSFDE